MPIGCRDLVLNISQTGPAACEIRASLDGTLGKWRKKDLELKVIFRYKARWGTAWAWWGPVSKVHPAPQGSGNITGEGLKRMWKLKDDEGSCEILSSGCDMAAVLRNLLKLWPTQEQVNQILQHYIMLYYLDLVGCEREHEGGGHEGGKVCLGSKE